MNQQSKNIFIAIVSSVVTTLAIIALIGGIFYFNRTKINTMLSQGSGTSSTAAVAYSDTAIVNTVKKTNPAVVAIIVTKDTPVYEQYYLDQNDPFGFFDFPIPQYRQNGTKKQEIGGGSGFFVSQDGLIVTNQHVVDDEKAEYTVYTNDGKKHKAKVVAKDETQDIAFIKIDMPVGVSYPYLSLGSSKDLQPGQTVIAIGNALGEYRNTVSVGVISGLSRSIVAGSMTGQAEQLDEVIQTDAAINPGNSGGPLLDVNGNVVGVNVAVAIGSQSIGFALPADSIKAAVASVQEKGYISRAYLGVRYIPITEEVKTRNKLSVDYGVLVARGVDRTEPAIVPGSPAEKAGIVENDVILEFNGMKLTEENKLATLIRARKTGENVTLKVLHKGQEKIITATLGEYKSK